MHMAPAMGSTIFLWLFLIGGGGVPVGVPPLPADPATVNIAPEQCLAYFSSAGTAEADPNSPNQTEQLFAEPEVRRMAAEIEKAIRSGFQKVAERGKLPPSLTPDDLVDTAKMLLTRPLAVYVSEVQMHPGGPIIRGGLSVNCGDEAAKAKTVLERVFKILPPQFAKEIQIDGQKWMSVKVSPNMDVVLGFKDNYLLAALGEGEIEAMQLRSKGEGPKWLHEVHKNLPVDRVATVTYFNTKAAMQLLLPMAGPQGAKIVDALGLENVGALESVTGLDKEAFVAKSLWRIDGEPKGFFSLANVKPLTTDDLAVIPADATIAASFKLDPAALFKLIEATVEKLDPHGRAVMDAQITQMEMMLGVKLRDDILNALGDTWCVFDSPNEGGAVSGLTLVSQLKDAKKAAAAHEKLIQIPMAMMARMAEYGEDDMFSMRHRTRLFTIEYKGHKIYAFDSGMFGPPCTPAWCFTDKELIASLNPQGVMGYLSRGDAEDFQSLAKVPEVAELFKNGEGPMKFAYVNTRRVFDVVYPMLTFNMKYTVPMLQRSGIKLDMTVLPSARAIRPHLKPTVISARRVPLGIEIIERRTMPGPSVSTAVPVMTAMLVPAVQSSRQAARRIQARNNLKHIGLAMHNYHQSRRAFPPAYSVDKDGKPLLSWRVLILPYLEGDNIYDEFHLDEPWDSEHNKKLIEKMPSVYKSPASKVADQGKTNYLTVRGDHTIYPGKDGTHIAKIRDGTSNTIMTLEVSDDKAVIWTKPDDYKYDEKNPMDGLVGLWSGGFHAGFADGSVQFIRSSIDPKILVLLFKRDDGQPIDSDDY